MRDYIFRGFHPSKNGSKTITLNGKKIRGEWIEGSLIQTHMEYSDGRKEIACEIRTRCIGVELESFDGGYMAGCEEAVIPETVGQFTGLTDKSGNKIFEGDILSTDLKRPYNIVGFRNGAFMLNCNDGEDDYYDYFCSEYESLQTETPYFGIIGNIHENAELLEEE